MKEILQPGMHPDADRLSTFVEGAATAQERKEMLAHLAGCAECRRVVFLMQEQEETHPRTAEMAKGGTWRWLMPAGLAGAALACGLAMVMYVRTHRGAGEIAGQNAQVQAPVTPKIEPTARSASPEAAAQPEMQGGAKVRGAGGSGAGAEKQAGAVPREMAGTGVHVPSAEAPAIAGNVNGMAVADGRIASLNAPAAAAPAVPMASPMPKAAEMKPLPLEARNAPAPKSVTAAAAIPALRIEHGRGPDDGTSQLSGRVTDQTGAVVAGATVTLHDAAGNTRQTASGADGSFNMAQVPPGHYELQVMARGFARYQQAIDLKPRDMAMLDTALTVGTESQTVSVQADALKVQTDANVVSTLASSQQVSEIATENRNFAALAALPTGLPAASTATLGRRVLSLDNAGTLFVSHNGGKSWKKVKPKWNGKVARIETANAGANAQAVFQLTTDSGAVWKSEDGTHWRAR